MHMCAFVLHDRRTQLYAGIAVRIYTLSVTGFLLPRCAGLVSLTATDGNEVIRRAFKRLMLVTIYPQPRVDLGRS